MVIPGVSPWFASLLLLSSHVFPPGAYADLEVERDGTVWVLLQGRPELFRVSPDGSDPVRHVLDRIALPAGLALDGTGGVWVSDAMNHTLSLHDRHLREAAVLQVPGAPGDLAVAGLDLWYIDTDRGTVVSTSGLVLARGVPAGTRLFHDQGWGYLAGDGVVRLHEGEAPERLSPGGSGCPGGGTVLLLRNGALFTLEGDTLLHSVTHTRVSASPGGDTVILWGGPDPPRVVR